MKTNTFLIAYMHIIEQPAATLVAWGSFVYTRNPGGGRVSSSMTELLPLEEVNLACAQAKLEKDFDGRVVPMCVSPLAPR